MGAFAAAAGGFLQSYSACAIAGALIFISREFALSPSQEGLAAGIILLGAMAGSFAAGYFADRWGRRLTLMGGAFLYLICNLPFAAMSHFSLFLLCRFATGIAVGMTSLTVPLYLAETAPAEKRGRIVSLYQLAVTLGTVAAYLMGWVFASSGNWRALFLCTAAPALIQGICLVFVPDSAPVRFRPHHASPWKHLLSPLFRKEIWVGVLLVLFQQWGGINAIVYFTPLIFQEAGFRELSFAMIATFAMGVLNAAATLAALFLVDRTGRRALLLSSQAGASASLFLLSAAFFFPSLQGCVPWAVISFMCFYAVGLGPIPWVLISEMYPLAIRAKAMSAMTLLSWFSNFAVVASFPSWLASWGFAPLFGLYALIGTAALICFWIYVPEMKGSKLDGAESVAHSEADGMNDVNGSIGST